MVTARPCLGFLFVVGSVPVLLVSCSSLGPTHDYWYGGPTLWSPLDGDFSVGVEVIGEKVEFDEIETDKVFSDGRVREVDVKKSERKRLGVRLRVGNEDLSGFVQVFGEELDLFSDEMEALGIGFGLMGAPVFAKITDDFLFFGFYRGQFNFVEGETDITVFDPRTGGVIDVDDDEDAYYTELETELGLGFEYCGVRAGVGLYTSSLDGEIDTEPRDLDIRGSNAAVLFTLGFFHPDSWITAEVKAMVGDVQGISGGIGIKF